MQWTRSFWGKHPAFKDYIRINADEPMVYAFVQWLDRWWQNAGISGFEKNSGTSARFWIMSANAVHLACGIIAASTDAEGRPAPVLCAMKGVLPKRARGAWQMLPVWCMAPWQAMADFLEQRFDAFADFKNAFGRIPQPDFAVQPGCAEPGSMAAIRKIVQQNLAAGKNRFIREKMLCFFPDEAGSIPDCAEKEVFFSWMTAIREAVDLGPGSAFFRNTGGRTALYLYYRPLGAADFLKASVGKTRH
ncbi:hypothetical protein HNR65_000571 [Desulfosalsimonas propionicica]|uniref:Uncharacterized protein n=1 Tax=Desulfosalsimonas propionicica TaxID=332175 RepID=A0A7W0HJI7_9BACT|nr:TagF domain-containing protein [Desulfosalsimonas propionicica]MBA2880264.1 hypothetical protein [Desulfosalsimonas propionicica]